MRAFLLLLLPHLGHAAPEALREALVVALSVRDGAPSCRTLAEGHDPAVVRDVLVEIAEEVARPPWVPIRAAACVVEDAAGDEVALAVARRWIDDVQRPGLALVVAQGLDALPEDRALPLARSVAARAGEDRRLSHHVPRALHASRHEAVRALVE